MTERSDLYTRLDGTGNRPKPKGSSIFSTMLLQCSSAEAVVQNEGATKPETAKLDDPLTMPALRRSLPTIHVKSAHDSSTLQLNQPHHNRDLFRRSSLIATEHGRSKREQTLEGLQPTGKRVLSESTSTQSRVTPTKTS